jgi:hypothetical protein
MDMKGGFYTDLNLKDPHRKQKELVSFEPSNHVNLQPVFTGLRFSSQRVQEKRTGRKGDVIKEGPEGQIIVQWEDGTQSDTTMFYLTKLDPAFDLPPNPAAPPTTACPKVREDMYARNQISSFDFAKFKRTVLSGLRGLREFKGLSEDQVTEKLFSEWRWAKVSGIV